MPNGFHGPADEWARLETPLRQLDPVFESFAKAHGLRLTRNARGTPERSLHRGEKPVLLIQLFMESEAGPTYTLWVSASDHRSREDYWLHRTLIEAAPIDVVADKLAELLRAAYEQSQVWSDDYPDGG